LNSFVVNSNVINGNSLVDSIVSWKWSSSPTAVITKNKQDSIPTGKIYIADPGQQTISLTVKSLQGCSNTMSKSVIFRPYPKVQFSYTGQCIDDTTVFTDNSTTNSANNPIGTWQWDFGDGFVTSTGSGVIPSGTHGGNTKGTYTSAKHYFSNPGIYYVKLLLTTAQSSCSSKDSLKFYILPKIKPGPTSPYIQNFTSTNSGFVSNGVNSSWQFGTPSRKYTNLVSTGERAWYTASSDSSYNSDENSWVECPCFDLSDLTKPMVSIDLKSLVDKVDGAVLLYSTSNSSTWKQVGTNTRYGINWYDDDNLSSSSPGDRAGLPTKGITYPGWTGFKDTLSWRTARYSLDSVLGNSSVRFRIAFGSTKAKKNAKFEGFAFKNFTVKDRAKVVLLEHFTNASAPVTGVANIIPSVDNNTILQVNKFNKNNAAVGVIPIFYHTSFPGKDTLNALNPADPSSKYGQYGISSVPRTILDGNFFNGSSFGQAGGWTEDILTQRTLTDPVFAINFDVVTNTGFVNATANITALTNLDSAYYSIQMAVIENVNSVPGIVGGNGQKDFYYALRKFLPSGSGITKYRDWVKGATFNTAQTWTYTDREKPFDPAKVGVVGFIQNSNTKEVYQVGYKIPGLAANITDLEEDGELATSNALNLYPNPASDEVLLQFDRVVLNDRNWVIYDALGASVLTGKIEAGYNQSIVATSKLASGWYVLVVLPENGRAAVTKKLIIQH
ncbi:MAG: PKD domain-containing protein, partial [Cytophagales bacterium]|nr:PKD domain-containing protein [Cytophagales bacterium]